MRNEIKRIGRGWLPLVAAVTILVAPLPLWADETQPAPMDKMPTQLQLSRGTVNIDAAMIPRVAEEMEVLRLAPLAVPNKYIQGLLKTRKITAQLEKSDKSPDFMVARLQDKVVAFSDVKSGHFQLSPLLDQLKPTRLSKVNAKRLATAVFSRKDIIPKDDTRFVVGPASPLYGASYTRQRANAAATEKPGSRGVYLISVSAQRYVGKYAVFGPGSRAAVSFSDSRTIQGLSRQWQAAHIERRIRPAITQKEALAAIKAQLEPLASRLNASITVTSVTTGYYDGNRSFIQPVYRFTATIRQGATTETKNKTAITSHVIGYVPMVKDIESLPDLSVPPRIMPSDQPDDKVALAELYAVKEDDPTVGRYVVRNDNPNWVANANEFWSGLTTFPWMAPNFTNAQYYWAIPQQYTTNKNNRVNSVNVALTEAHGDWWLFSTLSNCCDLVDITAIPGGYGTSAGGNLRYWAIHSCEVVPAPDDTSHWPDPWWNIFQGLHSVVGYRTIMYINDDTGYPFGLQVGLGVPFISAWLSALHNASAYSGNPATIVHGGHYPGDPCTYSGPNSILCKPMGRASAITACGHANDTVYNNSVLPPANCLTIYWYPD